MKKKVKTIRCHSRAGGNPLESNQKKVPDTFSFKSGTKRRGNLLASIGTSFSPLEGVDF